MPTAGPSSADLIYLSADERERFAAWCRQEAETLEALGKTDIRSEWAGSLRATAAWAMGSVPDAEFAELRVVS